jgi:hypothetical protein
MKECNLIDFFCQHNGACLAFSTYNDGRNRLDYAISSSSLLPYIQKCGYIPFYQGISSDHRGLILDFSTEIDGLTRFKPIYRRHLNSAFQQDAFKYKQCAEKEFRSHSIFDKASDICFQSGPMKLENQ